MKRLRTKYNRTKEVQSVVDNFSFPGAGISNLKDWLVLLDTAEQNGNNSSYKHLFKSERLAQVLFALATDWDLPVEAKFQAVELFDAFIVQHVRDLHKRVVEGSSTDKQSDWLSMLQRIKKQLPLRICTCCQIASKLYSNYHVVTLFHIQKALQSLNSQYSRECIMQSELRILKTLDYRVLLTTPYTYIGMLLKVLADNNAVLLDIKSCHMACVRLLELGYLRRRQLFDKLFFVTTGYHLASLEDKQKFHVVERDSLLLAGGAMLAACYLTNTLHYEQVLAVLADFTCLTQEDIIDMCMALLHLTFDTFGSQ